MPIHDWTRVPSGLFHHFHQDWSVEIVRTLNRGCLPRGVAALVERRAGIKEPDVLAIQAHRRMHNMTKETFGDNQGGVATAPSIATQMVRRSSKEIYAARANHIVVRHHLGRIVAIIEIISPGNKDSRSAIGDLLEKTIDFLRAGVHVLIVDLFPPTPRDPFGLHKVIWDEIEEEVFQFPAGKDRLLVSYEAGRERVAYIEPLAVGDPMPDMPLFLTADLHVKVPLEATYQATWNALPEEMRTAVETGELPDPDLEQTTALSAMD